PAHDREVQDIGIAGDEVLEQTSQLRLSHRVVHMIEKPSEGQDLTFADELSIEIGIEKLYLFDHGARDFALLHAFGIGELLLAEPQDLKMVKPEWQGADQQHRSQDHP